MGLERGLGSYKDLLYNPEDKSLDRSIHKTSWSPQLLVTPDVRDAPPSFGLYSCIALHSYMHAHTQTYTHTKSYKRT